MRPALALTLALLLTGCVRLDVQRLDEIERPARTAESVEVLLEEPARPYTTIAILVHNTTEKSPWRTKD